MFICFYTLIYFYKKILYNIYRKLRERKFRFMDKYDDFTTQIQTDELDEAEYFDWLREVYGK